MLYEVITKDAAMADDESAVNAATTAVARYERKVYKDLAIVKERFLGDQKHIEEFLEFFEEWKPVREEVIRLILAGKKAEAADITRGRGAEHVKSLSEKIAEIIEFADNKSYNFV